MLVYKTKTNIMKQNDNSSFIGLILMATILIIFNVFVFDNSSNESIKNSNSENLNNRSSKKDNLKMEQYIEIDIKIDSEKILYFRKR